MRSSPFTLIDDWRAPAPDPARVGWLGEWAYAHRGLHGEDVPENSPAAFRAAMELGLGIECDVQRAGDGAAIVFHDWEMERLTGASGAVAGLTAKDLAQVRLGKSEETVPTLGDVLRQIDGKVPLLIEVKSRGDARALALCLEVRRRLEGYRGKAAVMSFDPRVSRWFRAKAPHIVRGLVVTEDGRRTLSARLKRHLALWHAKPDFLAYDVRDLPSRFAAAQRARGLPVLTWTVKTADLLSRAGEHADAPIAEGAGIPSQK